ncbi:MAG: polymer-forming cytoskeletal protein [Lachnospiraceae bacterium]|jgi:cytoskeletal protein CcmA (bactofilin family)|nr:polymer-forming cytoskeletal protein [Lachnospiraceae bacterium]HBV81827.1 cell shape determination protein CcmA [Lachnospiraceae bacterium]
MLGKGRNSIGDNREKVSTVIGKDTTFDGDLTSAETIRIDGVINGNCTCEKTLILSADGQIKGNISAYSVVISGRVDGDITVQGKMELLSTGKIAGNIIAGSLVIDEGACFDGRCTMAAAISSGMSSFDSMDS